MISGDNPVDDSSVPETPESAIRAPNFRAAGQALGDGLGDSSWLEKKLGKLQDWVIDTSAGLTAYFLKRFVNIIGFLGEILLRVRANMDENLAKLASEGLSDLFGQDIQTAAFDRIGDDAGRKEIAQVLGNQVLRGIVGDAAVEPGQGIVPSDAAAKAFVTRMAELTVEGWFESIITGLASEHPFEKIGDLKEQVARTFGFGRIAPRVLRPAIDVLVTNPFKWQLHKQYRPQLLSEAHAVELYLRGKIQKDEMTEALARQGYSDVHIDNLVALGEKFLGTGEVAGLWLSGAWSREEAVQYLQQRGYAGGVAELFLAHAKAARLTAARTQAMDAARKAYVSRFIDISEFTKFVTAAIADVDIQHEIIAQASAERELNRSHVNEGKAEQAVILGFWTIQQYTDHLVRLGYNDEDILTMQLLVQEKIAETSDKVKARKDAAAARAAAKQAKLDAAKIKQQQLDQARSHRDLTLAQVHRAYVRGRLTLPQLQTFLVQQKQDPADIQELLDLAQAERTDYELAQGKRARADAKLAVTSLSTAQLEHLVKAGALTIAEYQDILQKEGIAASDVALLVTAAGVDLQASTEAKAHREAVAARQAAKGLSLAQFEMAVREGLRTMDAFRKYLADNKYTAADQESLVGLLADRIADDKAATDKKAAAIAKAAHKGIPLAELERAVRAKIRPMTDYRKALQDAGLLPVDIDTLAGLLQRQIDDDAAKAQHKLDAATKAAVHGISLHDTERAARLGIVSEAYYQQALTKAKIPPDEQAIMVRLLDADIAKVQAAKEKEKQAAAKLQNRPASLAVLKQGVLMGLRTVAEYRSALHQAGLDASTVELMAELAQDERAQRQAAEKRKAELDAKRSVREISRADFEKAVTSGLKTLPDYKAFLAELGYDEEDTGILYDLLSAKVGA